MKTTIIANQKGGVGKTTTAVNLSAAIARSGQRVLLIDLDPQGNASSGFGINPQERGAGDFLIRRNAEVIKSITSTLSLLPCDVEISRSEVRLASLPGGHLLLRQALETIHDQYDQVMIDCPPSLGIFPRNALAAGNEVIIPIQAEYYAMEGLAQIMAAIESMRSINVSLRPRGILFTMVDSTLEHARAVMESIRNHFPEMTFKTIITRDVSFSESSSYGKSILDYAPRSIGAHGYRELAREVLNG
jgi:chromosome partitioning protein